MERKKTKPMRTIVISTLVGTTRGFSAHSADYRANITSRVNINRPPPDSEVP